MAYTRIWDNTKPPGTQQAAKIDDEIRELRVDISERLSTITNWTADPITLLAGAAGSMRCIRYKSSATVGARKTVDRTALAVISVFVEATTDSNGRFELSLAEFPGTWTVPDLIGYEEGQPFMTWHGHRAANSPDDVQFGAPAFDVPGNLLRFVVKDFAGTLVGSKLIYGTMMLFNRTDPY